MVSVLVVPNVVWSFRRGRPRGSTQNKRIKVHGAAVDGGVYPVCGWVFGAFSLSIKKTFHSILRVGIIGGTQRRQQT
jgi:hypothetical protein